MKVDVSGLRRDIIEASLDPAALNIVNFDIILEYLRFAALSMDGDETDDFDEDINGALRFLLVLEDALDKRYDFSKTLKELYSYTEQLIMRARVSHDNALLDEARKIIGDIRNAFAVSDSQPEQYYGLTYDKSGRAVESYEAASAKSAFDMNI